MELDCGMGCPIRTKRAIGQDAYTHLNPLDSTASTTPKPTLPSHLVVLVAPVEVHIRHGAVPERPHVRPDGPIVGAPVLVHGLPQGEGHTGAGHGGGSGGSGLELGGRDGPGGGGLVVVMWCGGSVRGCVGNHWTWLPALSANCVPQMTGYFPPQEDCLVLVLKSHPSRPSQGIDGAGPRAVTPACT